jgi:TorA maturation chaperone TorD
MVENADLSLARAAIARYLKLALQSPDFTSYRALFSPLASTVLGRAASVLGVPHSGKASPPRYSELVRSYVRLFGHSLRGRVCPYEIEYGKREPVLQAQELSDVCGFYRAFGLHPSPGLGERWDHVAAELEFVELLSLKEAYAIETGDGEMYELTGRALKRFLREHLGHFGIALGTSLLEEDPGGYYGSIGGLLASYLASVCRELGVPEGPRTLPLNAIEDDGVPMACGNGVESADSPAFEV